MSEGLRIMQDSHWCQNYGWKLRFLPQHLCIWERPQGENRVSYGDAPWRRAYELTHPCINQEHGFCLGTFSLFLR